MNGTIANIEYVTGSGSTGSICCGFKAGSATPATSWKLDGMAPARTIPATPGTPGSAVNATKTGHSVIFTVAAGNTPPPPTDIDLQGNQKATVWIKY